MVVVVARAARVHPAVWRPMLAAYRLPRRVRADGLSKPWIAHDGPPPDCVAWCCRVHGVPALQRRCDERCALALRPPGLKIASRRAVGVWCDPAPLKLPLGCCLRAAREPLGLGAGAASAPRSRRSGVGDRTPLASPQSPENSGRLDLLRRVGDGGPALRRRRAGGPPDGRGPRARGSSSLAGVSTRVRATSLAAQAARARPASLPLSAVAGPDGAIACSPQLVCQAGPRPPPPLLPPPPAPS